MFFFAKNGNVSISFKLKVPNFKLTWEGLIFAFYKLILQWVTFVSREMRHMVPCRATGVSYFSPQHWPMNQYVKHLIVSDGHDRGKDTGAMFIIFLWLWFIWPYNIVLILIVYYIIHICRKELSTIFHKLTWHIVFNSMPGISFLKFSKSIVS